MINKELKLYGHIHSETDFWVTIHLPNSGMILDIMKKDLVKDKKESTKCKSCNGSGCGFEGGYSGGEIQEPEPCDICEGTGEGKSNEELKPCTKCKFTDVQKEVNDDGEQYVVLCECKDNQVIGATREQAIELWNRRIIK